MKVEELLEAIGCIDTKLLLEAEKVADNKLPKKIMFRKTIKQDYTGGKEMKNKNKNCLYRGFLLFICVCMLI